MIPVFIRCSVLLLLSLSLQACVPECVSYGYFDLTNNPYTEVSDYLAGDSVPGLSGAEEFPGQYAIRNGQYRYSLTFMLGRKYPSLRIQAEHQDGMPMMIQSPRLEGCFRTTKPTNKTVEVVWQTDSAHCSELQDLRLTLTDHKNESVNSLGLVVSLRKNGQYCVQEPS